MTRKHLTPQSGKQSNGETTQLILKDHITAHDSDYDLMGEMCCYEHSGDTDADLNQPESTPKQGPGQSVTSKELVTPYT